MTNADKLKLGFFFFFSNWIKKMLTQSLKPSSLEISCLKNICYISDCTSFSSFQYLNSYNFSGGEHQNTLHEVSVPIVSTDDCALAYSRIKSAAFLARGSTHVLCAGLKEGGKDSCKVLIPQSNMFLSLCTND